jgi:chromosome segregation ATPase
MPKDYVTKKYLDSKNYATQKDLQVTTKELHAAIDELKEGQEKLESRISQEFRNIGAIVEETNHKLDAVIEAVGQNSEKITAHDDQIKENTKNIQANRDLLTTSG